MSGRDHYEVLGITRSAGAGDVRRAYRALALRYHPDVYAGADADGRFREVADAYDVLRDPARRARYDAMSRPIARRPRAGPRFIDEDDEVGGDDLRGALLRELLQPGWARTRSTTREVWQWH